MQTPCSCLEGCDHCFEQCVIFLTVALSLLKLASYAQELDEIVEALFPLFVEQVRLEPHTIKRMRLSRIAGGFDVTPVLLRSPTAFLAQSFPVWQKQLECEQWNHWEPSKQPRHAQRKLKLMGLFLDERGMPREGDSPNREMDVARVGDKALRKRQASWKQPWHK